MPRIRANTVAEHRELMWSQLLDAFGDLLADKGYADMTLAEVAARAGMARNTIYNYADDKEALLMAYIGRAVEQFVAAARAELDTLGDARERLAWLIRKQMHQFVTEPGGGSDSGMLEGNALGPSAHVDLQLRFEPLHTLMAEIVSGGIANGDFRADLDAEQVVPMVSAVIGSERVPVGSRQHDPDVAADQVTAFVLRALV
ncbi:MAG: TetR/AcrR family transcriptional regulator [Propionibacteriaceae bacterium]